MCYVMNWILNLMEQIKIDTGILLIMANQTAPKPPLPYGTYHVTTSYIKGIGQPDTVLVEKNGKMHMKQVQEYLLTLSLNFYAATNLEAINIAYTIRKWFETQGYEYLNVNNLVVAGLGNIEDRTTFLVDAYEYKHGFDVQLRTMDIHYLCKYYQPPNDEDPASYDWIEHVELKFDGVKEG